MSSTLKESTLKRSTPKRLAGPGALGAAAAAALLAGAHAGPAHAGPIPAGPAHPGAADHKLVLSGYEDDAAGAQLLAGRYGAVIEKLAHHGRAFTDDEVAASTNLCVAYIMTAKWDAAHAACDEAIALASLDVPQPGALSLRAHNEQIALAYSNRAVLQWLEDHRASAADDLSKAKALSPDSEAVSQNLTMFGSVSGMKAAAVTRHG